MTTLCLTIPETPSRRLASEKHFAERGVEGVKFMPGIDGTVFGLDTRREYGMDGPASGFRIPPKVVGIFLSHYAAWMACSLLDDESFLILEDDAEFPENWKERWERAMADTPPDFDILYVGSCCCANKPSEKVNGEVFIVEWPLCLHAYIVAKKALPTLIRTQRNVYAPIDVAMAIHSLPYLKTYTVIPRIVGQRSQPLPD